MAILFHCKFCNKEIKAKEEKAGKWGTCPSCHNKIYVPNLNVDVSDLKLAPVDEAEEKHKQQLKSETFMLEQEILKEREAPGENAVIPQDNTPSAPVSISNAELNQNIIAYLRFMADGDLDKAEALGRSIIASGKASIKILDQIALSDMPEPEIADIPPQVLSGLIRQLRAQIV